MPVTEVNCQYWWVNHKQTVRQEIEGQYLWSPKTESNGARSEFYNNMRRASPGDLVLSYANQEIQYIGRVAEIAFTAPKPEEFGDAGAYWNQEGWLLPVYWVPLNPSVRPKAIIEVLRPYLPERYSPIQSRTGGGNQKAYLARISEGMFDTVVGGSSFDKVSLASGGSNSLKFEVVTELLDDAIQRQIVADQELEDTVRESVIMARRGQGKFRSNVERTEQCCRLTGITNPLLLIASHIKPWRLCNSARERLDGNNGLLLTPDVDHLFDRGFVSFANDGNALVSPRIPSADLQRLGLGHITTDLLGLSEASTIWGMKGFSVEQNSYLNYHRSEIFIS